MYGSGLSMLWCYISVFTVDRSLTDSEDAQVPVNGQVEAENKVEQV